MSSLKVFRHIEELQSWRKEVKGRIGFVPTMGALHEGHAELLRRARQENDLVILSLFVNPTQFNNPNDLNHYPRTWDQDVQLAAKENVDVLFAPDKEQMYPDQYSYQVKENCFSLQLDGAHRPGHFDGVLTIVMKLFSLTKPTKAYFGEKDFQQMTLIQGMVKSFFMDLEIVPVPTVRESSGLALSSRNLRLTPEQKEKAVLISKLLHQKMSAEEVKKELSLAGFKVDYVEDHNDRRYIAAEIGNVRLIDNAKI